MQFLILAAGKPSLGYAKEGVELYLNRLRPFGKTELKLVRDGNSQDVSKRLLAASEGCLRIAMDERENFGPQKSWSTWQRTGKCIPYAASRFSSEPQTVIRKNCGPGAIISCP